MSDSDSDDSGAGIQDSSTVGLVPESTASTRCNGGSREKLASTTSSAAFEPGTSVKSTTSHVAAAAGQPHAGGYASAPGSYKMPHGSYWPPHKEPPEPVGLFPISEDDPSPAPQMDDGGRLSFLSSVREQLRDLQQGGKSVPSSPPIELATMGRLESAAPHPLGPHHES